MCLSQLFITFSHFFSTKTRDFSLSERSVGRTGAVLSCRKFAVFSKGAKRKKKGEKKDQNKTGGTKDAGSCFCCSNDKRGCGPRQGDPGESAGRDGLFTDAAERHQERLQTGEREREFTSLLLFYTSFIFLSQGLPVRSGKGNSLWLISKLAT